MNIAIIGTGNIACHMATALRGLKDEVAAYAVASRSIEKAQAFADEWGFKKAYGSYEELVKDEYVDLIYIATPHSAHYENTKLCIENGKNVLVEKAFTSNAAQAKELVQMAREKGVLLAEAIWTRYMPSRKMIEDIISRGEIGETHTIEADFSIPISHVKRLVEPELSGGALLDLGMYALTFAAMYFGTNVKEVSTTCEKYETGVDATDVIDLVYEDGKKAHLKTSMVNGPVNEGRIIGDKGCIYVDSLNNPSKIEIQDTEGEIVCTYNIPEQINGYEYEVLACKKALEDGKIECDAMPLKETVRIMGWMDSLRKKWGCIYPFENDEIFAFDEKDVWNG